MQHAFEAGTIVAVIAGITGYFVVLRRSAFTAHAFSEIGFAGAAGAVLLGIAPIAGLLLGSILGGLAIAALGRRATNRDTQIGIVLAFALGLGLLFISLYTGYATEAYSILFGEILGISSGAVLLTLVAGVGILIAVGVLYRPLLFASLDEDVAEAKGMPMLFLGTAFMLVVAVAVSFAVQVTGVLLIFSLMVTPAATAQYLSRRPQTGDYDLGEHRPDGDVGGSLRRVLHALPGQLLHNGDSVRSLLAGQVRASVDQAPPCQRPASGRMSASRSRLPLNSDSERSLRVCMQLLKS